MEQKGEPSTGQSLVHRALPPSYFKILTWVRAKLDPMESPRCSISEGPGQTLIDTWYSWWRCSRVIFVKPVDRVKDAVYGGLSRSGVAHKKCLTSWVSWMKQENHCLVISKLLSDEVPDQTFIAYHQGPREGSNKFLWTVFLKQLFQWTLL